MDGIIYPSLIAADLLNLESVIRELEPYCPGFHLDVMDNHFVPHISMGALWVNAIAHATPKKIWVHLMVDDPARVINELEIPTQSLITFHIEVKHDIAAIINLIRKKEWLPGLALNPQTPVAAIEPFLSNALDHVLIMSVTPGSSGQPFMQETLSKIGLLANAREEKGLGFIIGMDGGINSDTIEEAGALGVEMFAVASGIFGKE